MIDPSLPYELEPVIKNPNFWMYWPHEAGTKAYAEAVQRVIGGTVVIEKNGWHWVSPKQEKQ